MTHSPAPGQRLGPSLAAFVIGLPLAAALLALFHYGPLRETVAFRYVEYPVQWAEVVLFGCAVGGLIAKFLHLRREWEACAIDILPRWDGKPVPVEKAADLMASVDRQPRGIQGTYFGRRLRSVLEYLCQRRDASELDDQLRSLADTDAIAQENSFSLLRFITWAIPILGFLGTVIGITGAISGVTPEALEESLSSVTDGLSEAFDSTALALGLTMIVMFVTSLIERQEQSLLETVDRLIERQLAHRFQRVTNDQAPILAAVRESSSILTGAVETVVQRQADLMASALAEPQRLAVEMMRQVQEQLTAGVAQALERALTGHAQRLAAMEQQTVQASTQVMQQLAALASAIRDTGREQQAAISTVAESIMAQAEVLGKLQEGETNLVHLQAVLHQNLAAIAAASNFEEAVHSLTAAVHMLTTRVGGTSPRPQIGKAA